MNRLLSLKVRLKSVILVVTITCVVVKDQLFFDNWKFFLIIIDKSNSKFNCLIIRRVFILSYRNTILNIRNIFDWTCILDANKQLSLSIIISDVFLLLVRTFTEITNILIVILMTFYCNQPIAHDNWNIAKTTF